MSVSFINGFINAFFHYPTVFYVVLKTNVIDVQPIDVLLGEGPSGPH